MAVLTKGPAVEGFIVSEANGSRSREELTIAAEQDFEAGAALVVDASGEYQAFDPAITAVGYAIACRGVTTAAGETAKVAAIMRDAEVLESAITFPDGTLEADIDTFLAAVADNGVVAR